MGRWSARHRKTAIVGWLAFVVASVAMGAVLGTKQLDPDTIGVGESKRAQEIIEVGGFVDSADESVLVASKSHRVSDLAFRAVLADVVRVVSGEAGVSNVVSPLDPDGGTLVAKDGHAALVQFEISHSSNPFSRASHRFSGVTRRSASRSSAARVPRGRSTRRSARTSRGPSSPRSRSLLPS